MTVLVISPDYLSHYNPLSVLASALASQGHRIVVATGTALADRVTKDGFEWRHLALGPARNPGVVGDDPAIRRFLTATGNGPLATILHQAAERERDLLWQPERVANEVDALLATIKPAHVIVDHVSFTSTLALYATGREFLTLVPGHPTQLPVGAERYGVPPEWPACMQPAADGLAQLESTVDRVSTALTDRWNETLAAIGSSRPPVMDASRVHGQRVLYNSIECFQAPDRSERLPTDHRFVGPLVRSETPTPPFESWHHRSSGRPQVYVALGTFLARRSDVLARIADGLRSLDVRAAIATGPMPLDRLGPVPEDWIVAPTLPQVALLQVADLAIHHGGNNSVQEAHATGTRQIVLPFSTDQFANATDLQERAEATVLAPNEASAEDLAAAVVAQLRCPRPEASVPLGPDELTAAILGSTCRR